MPIIIDKLLACLRRALTAISMLAKPRMSWLLSREYTGEGSESLSRHAEQLPLLLTFSTKPIFSMKIANSSYRFSWKTHILNANNSHLPLTIYCILP